ncbi:hypothetical protein QQX98_001929 [Neonectria punicea]|uniref:Uncharacterized protein n=1 Tax=Neonectria punicea TaxID=979145 RepID=A0ABR1HL56_9HYPO
MSIMSFNNFASPQESADPVQASPARSIICGYDEIRPRCHQYAPGPRMLNVHRLAGRWQAMGAL